jgi:FkbM family methyltransferase
LPLSHSLPRFRHKFPNYGLNLGRVGRLVKDAYPDMSAIDVGANIGDSVAILRAYSRFPILCIEGDPFFFPLLLVNTAQIADVDCVQAYVGAADEEVPAAIVRERGTARVDRSHPAAAPIPTRTLAGIVAAAPRFARPHLLKIDTDGFDCAIIRGSAAFVSQTRPVVFFEYDPHLLRAQGDDGLSLFKTLAEMGYRDMLVYANTGCLMEAVRTDDEARLAEIHASCGPLSRPNYVDIAAYHVQDHELFTATLHAERDFRRATEDSPLC